MQKTIDKKWSAEETQLEIQKSKLLEVILLDQKIFGIWHFDENSSLIEFFTLEATEYLMSIS